MFNFLLNFLSLNLSLRVELFEEVVVNTFKDLSENRLESWLEEVIAIKSKREIVNGLSKAFNEPVVLLMDRKKPLGVFIKLDKVRNFQRRLGFFFQRP
jgi:hypothetical protein